jgi:hypothetical protein
MAKSLTLDEFRALPADHRPEAGAARQEYIQRQAEAGRLAGLGTDLSTPEGVQAWEAEHSAGLVWESYCDAWFTGRGPEPEPEAEP